MAGEDITTSSCPQRTITELQDRTNSIDITVWDELAPHIREGDIVVDTSMKSGTTWMMQAILQMINNGEETLSSPNNRMVDVAPWIENMVIFPNLGAKLKTTPPQHRGLIKSHLQPEALLFSPKLRYVCLFRDRRDNVMSLFNHCRSWTEEFRNSTKQDAKYLEDFNLFFENWLYLGNEQSWGSWTDYFEHYKSWWEHANSCDNILIVNYSEMQRDLGGVGVKLGAFLDIRVDDASVSFQSILRHSSFQYMKEHEELFEPPLKVMKPGNYIHKGVSRRWQDVLSESQQRLYWDKVAECWSPELIEFVHKDSSRQ